MIDDHSVVAAGEARANAGPFEQQGEDLRRLGLRAIERTGARKPPNPVGADDFDFEGAGIIRHAHPAPAASGEVDHRIGRRCRVARHDAHPTSYAFPE